MNSKWFRELFRRRVYIILMLAVQLAFILYIVINGGMASSIINYSLRAVSVCVVFYIVSSPGKTEYKMIWMLLVLTFPIFGGFLYLLYNFQRSTKKFSVRLSKIEQSTRPDFKLIEDCPEQAVADCEEYKSQINYLDKTQGFPVYKNTAVKYLSPGEEKFKYMLEELEKAERYIFLEYFIVESGEMWDSILEILKRKAKQGVEVRMIYDDLGCFLLLPNDYPKQLEKFGIKCKIFNKFRPVLSSLQNNRDHRKIAVIDGKVAFTGGINLADEYINKRDKHGYWKDASVMLSGDAAWSLTVMFLQMWEVNTGEHEDLSLFLPAFDEPAHDSDGYVQPYADSPVDNENVGEGVYLNIISAAKDYLYIATPYLVIDESLLTALKLAAKNGVDVRIITPKNKDKWFVHETTRSYYKELISAGIKIYEFRGFIHSKIFLADGKIGTVGTVNLDFRSLYLHFECGTVLYKNKALNDVYDDYIATLGRSDEITPDSCKCNIFTRVLREFLRMFAPLM